VARETEQEVSGLIVVRNLLNRSLSVQRAKAASEVEEMRRLAIAAEEVSQMMSALDFSRDKF
jgi:hypothetical protein